MLSFRRNCLYSDPVTPIQSLYHPSFNNFIAQNGADKFYTWALFCLRALSSPVSFCPILQQIFDHSHEALSRNLVKGYFYLNGRQRDKHVWHHYTSTTKFPWVRNTSSGKLVLYQRLFWHHSSGFIFYSHHHVQWNTYNHPKHILDRMNDFRCLPDS